MKRIFMTVATLALLGCGEAGEKNDANETSPAKKIEAFELQADRSSQTEFVGLGLSEALALANSSRSQAAGQGFALEGDAAINGFLRFRCEHLSDEEAEQSALVTIHRKIEGAQRSPQGGRNGFEEMMMTRNYSRADEAVECHGGQGVGHYAKVPWEGRVGLSVAIEGQYLRAGHQRHLEPGVRAGEQVAVDRSEFTRNISWDAVEEDADTGLLLVEESGSSQTTSNIHVRGQFASPSESNKGLMQLDAEVDVSEMVMKSTIDPDSGEMHAREFSAEILVEKTWSSEDKSLKAELVATEIRNEAESGCAPVSGTVKGTLTWTINGEEKVETFETTFEDGVETTTYEDGKEQTRDVICPNI